jgi:hypothetical protein
MSNDSEIETFLRRFRPKAPAPLASTPPRHARVWPFLALTAVAAIVIVSLAWRLVMSTAHSPRKPAVTQPRMKPTVGSFNAAIRAGNLDTVLDEMETRILPDPLRPGGALEALARDDALAHKTIGGLR